MCIKSLTLVGLISLVALTGAKLRWKCELFDTSQETSTKTTFVEFVKGKSPEPAIPEGPNGTNPRSPRSTRYQKCRPRPKNGTVGPSTETQKLKVEKNRSMVQSDVPGILSSGDTDVPHVKYQRKETHQSLDLNIGPGFEESNDPYGKSKQPVPKLFRPAHLMGADELDKPLTEHLDENVMPDFELDDDDLPPILEDLPWCPEEPEDDCETVDLESLSVSELVELKQKCETTVSTERKELIDKLIRTERNQPGVIPTDRTAALPPTGATNCSLNPSELRERDLEKYQKECPCENDTSKMSEKEFESFKKECLDPIEVPGQPYNLVRKNGRCGASEKKINEMGEKEYELFVKECLVGPKNIVLEKILIVDKSPECMDLDITKMDKVQFAKYQKKCVRSKNCDDVEKSEMDEKELARFKKICGSITRKIKSLCNEKNVEDLDDDPFERYKRECILGEGSFDCDSVNPKELSENEFNKYLEECTKGNFPPNVKPLINCKSLNQDELNDEEYARYKEECLGKPASECAQIDPDTLSDEEYRQYAKDCLSKESNCTTADPRDMTDEQYERFEKACLKKSSDCRNVKVKDLNEEEYRKYRRECLKRIPRIDCSRNPDEMTDEEYRRYQEECRETSASECAKIDPERLNDKEYKKYKRECLSKESNCTTADPREMTNEQYERFEKACLKKSSDCRDVKVKDLSEEEYRKYLRECLMEKGNDLDCDNVKPKDLTKKELRRFLRECVKDSSDCRDQKPEEMSDEEYEKYAKKCLKRTNDDDCESVNPKKLTETQYKKFEKECLKSKPDCQNVNPNELSDEDYEKYLKDCLEKSKYDCSSVNPEELEGDELEKYNRKCLSDDEINCQTAKPSDMSKKEYKLFMRKCVKNTLDCTSVNVKDLSEKEYEKYKMDCLKSETDCLSVNPDKLTVEEYKQYKEECLDEEGNLNCDAVNPKKLTRKQYQKYEKKCLERKSSENCDNINPDDLSDEEYEKYKEDCLRRKTLFDCKNVDVEKLSDKEYRKYERECLDKKIRSDCDDVRPDELSREEYRKYEKECLPGPRQPSPDCDVNVDELDDEEFMKYKKRCGSQTHPPSGPGENVEITKTVRVNKPNPDCENVKLDELSKSELEEYDSRCGKGGNSVTVIKKVIINNGPNSNEPSVSPPDGSSEGCRDVDVDKMTDYQYNAYKKYCKPSFEGEDCDEVRVDKLSDEKLREYVEKCGLFCGIERKKALLKKDQKKYEEKCEGDTNELDKDCKDIAVEKLGERMYGNFAEKCLEPINACSMLKSKRLVRKVYNEYRLRCEPRLRPSETSKCEEENTENMTLEEYKDYKRRCGKKNGMDDCDNVNVDELSEREFAQYKKNCPVDTRHEECKDIDVNELSQQEYKKYLKMCGRPPTSEASDSDCDSANVDKLTQDEFLAHMKLCPEHNPDSIQKCEDLDWRKMSRKDYLEFQKMCPNNPSKDRTGPFGGGPSKNCSNSDVEKMSDEEYKVYRRECLTTRKTPKPDCDDVNVDELSDEEYRQYQRNCGPNRDPDYPEKPNREDCHKVKIEELSSDEYLAYKKRCLSPEGSPRAPGDCSTIDVDKLSSEEYDKYRKTCKPVRITPNESPESPESRENPRKPSVSIEKTVVVKTPHEPENYDDCDSLKVSDLSDAEYREYKRRCGPERNTPKSNRPDDDSGEKVPGDRIPHESSVTLEKTVVVNPSNPGERPDDDCSSVRTEDLSDSEYEEFKKRCGPGRKTSKPDCDDVDVDKLSDEEYRSYEKRCGREPDSPRRPSVVVEKTVKIERPPKDGTRPPGGSKPPNFDDCSNVNVAKLTDDEYDEYRRECKPTRKTTSPECDEVDVETISGEKLEEYYKKCSIEEVPPSRPREMDCSDINVEDLDREEYLAYKKRCGSPKRPDRPRSQGSPESPESPRFSDDCDGVKVEELTNEEYAVYKKKCLKKPPRRPQTPDDNCSKVNTDELTESEYRAFTRRCPESVTVNKTVVIDAECQNKNTDGMTKEEYQQFQKECSRKPRVELTKIVKIIDGPTGNKEEDECAGKDVNDMNDDEFADFQKKCREFRKPFQFNCNMDVTKMSDREFEKFRKACGKKPFDCETADVDSLSDRDYSRFLKECGKRPVYDCDSVKVERLDAEEFEEYKKKCKKTTTKTSNNCKDVQVETLSRKEYIEYKEKCLKKPRGNTTPPSKIRKRVDCSIVDESMMSEEEYADFKQHCNVKVTTDRYRPGENMILTKKVNIRTAKEKFSCYDQDVDHMSDEEYANFEKKCLSNPHFRFDCRTVDTTELSREEYAKYQRECAPPKKIVLEEKLVVNKTNEPVKNGCYNRDVDTMTDEEYAEYEVTCLGREPTPPSKPERKSSFDCHNVDLSKLSYPEIEEHIKRCRTRETASTQAPPPPIHRQSLKCSDVKTDDLDDAAYAKWVKECLETTPKTIELEKKLIITPTTPLLSGGEKVIVEKFEIYEHLRPDDDEGYLEGNEDFGVRVLTGIRKKVIKGRPDDDSESETGVVLVKKVIHKIPGRRRPSDVDDDDDESGVIEVKKLIMKTSQPEPDTDDSEDVEEIMRRPRKVDPREEVVLLSVTKKHPHSYRTKNRPDEEEPTEVVKLTKNTRHPNATLREVRVRKHFGTGLPEETVVQEIGGPDFKITRKTVMKPHKVRKMKSTTTTTTTPAEPEYYYDEEEVPEYITLVRVEKSSRPLRKTTRPNDEDDEYVDVKEDKPKSYIEFEGFVKVHGSPRKLRKKTTFTDSGEEPDIREVTRKIPGREYDDFKGVKLRSHRKKLILIRKIQEEVPDDVEREVTVVKKLKVLKFGNEEEENFDDDDNVEDDGMIIVKNRKRKYLMDDGRKRPGEDEEGEEYVEGRIAVRGKAPKIFRWNHSPERKGAHGPRVTEQNSQYYRIGRSEEDDVERRRRRRKEEERPRALEEEEEDGFRRRRRPDEFEEEEGRRRRQKPRYEEESEEIRHRKKNRPGLEEESEEEGRKRKKPSGLDEDVIIKKLYRINPKTKKTPSEDKPHGESVILTKKKIIKYEPNDKNEEEPDESGEIKLLKRKKFYRIGPDGRRKLVKDDEPTEDGDREIVKIKKKKVYRIGPNGERELVDEEGPRNVRKISNDQPDVDGDEEIKLMKRKKFYRIGPDGKRDLVREEEIEPSNGKNMLLGEKMNTHSPEPLNDAEDEEEIQLKKKKRFYKIGPDGKRELVREEEGDGPMRKISEKPGRDEEESVMGAKKRTFGPPSDDVPRDGMDGETMIMKKKKKRIYRIGPDGKRQLVREEEMDPSGRKTLFGEKQNTYSPEPLNDTDDGEEIRMKKKKRFYKIGPDGKRELVREEEGDESSGGMYHRKKSGLLGDNENTYSPEPLNDENDGEEIQMKKKKRFYKIGPHGKRELVREEGEDSDADGQDVPDGEEMMTHKKKRFYKIGPDGKRELVRTEGGDEVAGDEEKMTGLKKIRRFYKIGKDGKRELVRTEGGDGTASDHEKTFERKSSNSDGDLKSDEPMNPVSEDVKPTPGGRLSVPDESEENVSKNDDGYEYEVKPRVKRTYVLDGQGNRKLVGETTGNEDSNLDLGRLLKPRRKITETKTVDREHEERQYQKVGSIRATRSSSKSGSNGKINKKMQKYHKDQNLRSGGKSEEDIPEEP